MLVPGLGPPLFYNRVVWLTDSMSRLHKFLIEIILTFRPSSGVSGPFWYAAGATIQIILFATLAIELKRRAPNAHTFLEVVKARYVYPRRNDARAVVSFFPY
jgi:hypothetical protein